MRLALCRAYRGVQSAGDRAGDDADVVSRAQHRRHRDQAHEGDDRAHDAGGRCEDRAGRERRDGQGAGQARQRQVQAVEQALDEVRALHHVAHEHEQRDGDQHVVGHHRVGALDHQVERLLPGDTGVDAGIGDEGEEDTHAHQGEGGREAQHDRDDDRREHQQADVAVAQVVPGR